MVSGGQGERWGREKGRRERGVAKEVKFVRKRKGENMWSNFPSLICSHSFLVCFFPPFFPFFPPFLICFTFPFFFSFLFFSFFFYPLEKSNFVNIGIHHFVRPLSFETILSKTSNDPCFNCNRSLKRYVMQISFSQLISTQQKKKTSTMCNY
ncbi:conserved hypothetical protein [Lodderomyces elongisporus NRRL YB-4239]|uniref:Transmembrane protein n=1 Tax=Lodderomyces elongisporus (strain ATCC 11503 / CBS 2605 / JCM 1781 / NBRC 1676 / NRRL YB-4239) TaxID=379508 RepID=A5DWT1_LODEL|nr:conserved hypothetical protein [Lodderomyces elongisporus NRRL YB-4239]